MREIEFSIQLLADGFVSGEFFTVVLDIRFQFPGIREVNEENLRRLFSARVFLGSAESILNEMKTDFEIAY